MRAVILGGKNLAVGCLEVILRHGLEVAAIIPNGDDDGSEEGKWYKSLKKSALEKGLPVFQPRTISSPRGLTFIEEMAPDLIFSFSYNRILKGCILERARVWPLNIHFSRLPHYRGCLSIVYAMANSDPQVGVTLHVMDEGIDTGDIISQVLVDVGVEDTAYSVYFKCVQAGIHLMNQTLPKLLNHTCQAQPQELAAGSYHSWDYPNDRWLSPDMSPDELSCFVRAHTFLSFPTARAVLRGQEHDVIFRNSGFSVPGLNEEIMNANELSNFLAANGFGCADSIRASSVG